MRSIESGRWTMMDDVNDLIALVHAQGVKAGRDPARSRLDCPFCNDRIDLCSAWLAGFSLGRMSRQSAEAAKPAA
jgi:ribosome modulation factor